MGVSRTEEAQTLNVLCTEYLVSRILSGLQFFWLECELFFAGNKKTMYTVPQYLFDNWSLWYDTKTLNGLQSVQGTKAMKETKKEKNHSLEFSPTDIATPPQIC